MLYMYVYHIITRFTCFNFRDAISSNRQYNMAKIMVETLDGIKMEYLHAGGITLPLSFTPFLPEGEKYVKHVQGLKYLHIRDDDLYLATYPKCGTHWTWEIMTMLQKGDKEYSNKQKESVFVDFRPNSKLDQVPSPRILNSHYADRLIPREIIEKKIKIVNVMRNPKDTFVSLYYHMKALLKEDIVRDFKTFLPYAMGTYGVCMYQPFYEYIKGWEAFTKEHPDQILNLFYEDMKEDPIREIRKINEFLGTNRDDELIEQIAEACSFKNLKKADADVKVQEEGFVDLSFMYRKDL
ncbi:hypothetical protein ACF0H5_016012 [Mactra antiquata]